MTIVYFDYVQRSCSSLYRLLRFTNRPTYITLLRLSLNRCQKYDTNAYDCRTRAIWSDPDADRSQNVHVALVFFPCPKA